VAERNAALVYPEQHYFEGLLALQPGWRLFRILAPALLGAQALLSLGARGLGAVQRPRRFPMKIHFVWGFCVGAQGA
jgi:hypothetical protein